ncbi:MAG: FkbM family methyltransferase [Prevotellaceae bacterium]|jgi:FkbM family methyltransferase|nr:FkbM family methyltransferase [Prevotellaceae bacterium]
MNINSQAVPQISVLIPLYNSQPFIKETVYSVLSQTFRDFELLLMDDGSTDSTAEIVKSIQDERIRYERCPHDFVGTFNRGLSVARGKYIALIDHDDLMTPERLQMQHDYLESHPDVAACGGGMQTFGASSEKMYAAEKYQDIMLAFLLRRRGPVFNPTGFFRRDVINRHSIRYRRGYAFAVDTKFWTEVSRVGKIVNLPETLVWYRTSQKQTSMLTLCESQKSAEVIYHEHVDFMLSQLDDKEELKSLITANVMPALKKMVDLSFFSADVYFRFIAEIIQGLYHNGFLNLEEPLSGDLPTKPVAHSIKPHPVAPGSEDGEKSYAALSYAEKEFLRSYEPLTAGYFPLRGKKFKFSHAPSFADMAEEIFEQEIYQFKTDSERPYIIDGGANIGLSMAYFAEKFPNAQIIGFEPDKVIFPILKENMEQLDNRNVRIYEKAVWYEDTVLDFYSEQALAGSAMIDFNNHQNKIKVEAVNFNKFLNRKVDFLKLDIEGAENEVIFKIADNLRFVENMFLEYHELDSRNQNLQDILLLLKEKGFSYTIKVANDVNKFPFKKEKIKNYTQQLNIFCYRL